MTEADLVRMICMRTEVEKSGGGVIIDKWRGLRFKFAVLQSPAGDLLIGFIKGFGVSRCTSATART